MDVGDRWAKVQASFKPHLDNRALVWYDTHLMMTLVQGTPANESAAKFALAEHLIKVNALFVCEFKTFASNVVLHCHKYGCLGDKC